MSTTTGRVTARGADPMTDHPRHYNSHPSGIEAIDVKRLMTSDAGDAFKYVFRAELKNGRQDFDKARWYLKDLRDSGLPVWIPGFGCRNKGRDLLQQVIDGEPNLSKVHFFKALRNERVVPALIAVDYLLKEVTS